MKRYLIRTAIFCHRWLGLALCLLFTLWFASGIVMMYWGFPEIGAEERLRRAESLKPDAIRISPEAAYDRLRQAQPPDAARLTMLDSRPVYRFRIGGSEAMVYADTGEPLLSVHADMPARIAAAWRGRPPSRARFEGVLNDADQWTVSGEYSALRPLLKYSWPDGDQVYVSALTGEVVQHTTRASRLASYFGAIPHWLYWTPLRKNGRLWNRVVLWSSGAGTLVSLLGLLVGVWVYSQGKSVPYQGQKRWHVILGLAFGALAATWVFSGFLSMEPFQALLGSQEGAFNADAALRGGALDLKVFAPKPPREALEQAGSHVKELEFALFGGEPHYLARASAHDSVIVPVRGNPASQFDSARILQLVAQASQPASVAETRVVTEYDAYYLDRHRQHPLPALFVRLSDEHRSMFYIDPKTAQIVEAYDDRSRWNRWLYHGLHSWNLPWLYRNRPAWDIMVMVFLLGGTSLSVTAVIIGIQLMRRKARLNRVPAL